MENKLNSIDLRQKLDLFLSHYKIIIFCVITALAISYTYLRYATYKYSASAIIKIKNDEQSNKLPSLGPVGGGGSLFSDSEEIKDKIQILKSRTLIENVIKDLKLNITVYEEGNIKQIELYKNAPIKLSFFEADSIIHKVDTTLYIKIKSASEFLMFNDDGKSFLNRDDKDGIIHPFGDRIKTGFGDMVITPEIGKRAPKIGSNLKISITSVNRLIGGYQKAITVSNDKGSSVIKLSLEQSNAQKAIDILNQLIQEFNNDVLEDKEQIVQITSEFIDNRLQKVSEELEQVDYTSEQLQKTNKLTALGSQANIYLESEKQNEAQILNASNELELIGFLQDEVNDTSRTSDLLPLNVIGDPSITQITKTYNELVAQRDRLLKNSSAKNPVVMRLNDQISTQKNSLQNTLSNMKKSSEITLSTLNRENSRIGGQLYAAPTKQKKFRSIERQQGIKESLYLYLLEKREESTIKLGMYTPSAKIVDDAYSSYKPVSPNKTITYLAAILFGLAIPIGFIYAKDLIDTKIYNKEDLVNLLNIPYLGDIPRGERKNILINKVDYSPKAESFRIIRSNIDFMLKGIDGRAKKVFVTSTKAQEGKSHTSTNLAKSISYSEKSVLLIETDIRVPKVLEYFKMVSEAGKGLSDFIVDKSLEPQDVVIKHKENPYLDILPSGTIPPNPSELLMSTRVDELFTYFENKYDYIVVDTSAVGLVSDTLLISNHADMFIYVVGADNIDKRQLIHVAQPLYDKNRLPQMTLLLNGTKLGNQGYGYGYGNDPENKKKWYDFYS